MGAASTLQQECLLFHILSRCLCSSDVLCQQCALTSDRPPAEQAGNPKRLSLDACIELSTDRAALSVSGWHIRARQVTSLQWDAQYGLVWCHLHMCVLAQVCPFRTQLRKCCSNTPRTAAVPRLTGAPLRMQPPRRRNMFMQSENEAGPPSRSARRRRAVPRTFYRGAMIGGGAKRSPWVTNLHANF
jgi:hypothetical protein